MRELTKEVKMLLVMKDLGFKFNYRKGQTVWISFKLKKFRQKGIIIGIFEPAFPPRKRCYQVRLCNAYRTVLLNLEDMLPVKLSDIR